jgi:DNA-binding PadR family transcriptional regulator
MPREKFQTLTEQMFYILICLQTECCGIDIMEMVSQMTDGRVKVGPGTLYNLLEQFMDERIIAFTKSVGKKRSYIITDKGRQLLEKEYVRLKQLTNDYESFIKE